MKPKVYIAGPYSARSTQDILDNVNTAIAAADQLLAAGYIPFCPHLYHHWDARHSHPYETWIEICLAWLPACDALLRLPGESPGADREVHFAQDRKIPVFTSVGDLHHWREIYFSRRCRVDHEGL